MKYSNELKVGATIVIATVIFILGVRFFEDLPLFRGSYALETEMANAAGLIPGNVVRVAGVNVGSVDEVFINTETGGVRARFHVDSNLPIPEGSTTLISGFDALGVVRMDILLGPPGNPRIPEGGFLPSSPTSDLMAEMTDRAPALLDQFDAVMDDLGGVLQESNSLLADPSSDLRLTLLSARRAVDTIDNLLRTQRDRIASVLANVDGATASVDAFMAGNADSLSAAIAGLNQTLARLDQTLDGVDATSTQLTDLLTKINSGQGTLGRLVNDDEMYLRLDSTMTSIQTLLTDFQENPGRYLKEMRLVDLF